MRIVLGLLMTGFGLLGLATYVSPELPIKATYQLRSMGEPVGTLLRHWFEFANALQTMNIIDYGMYALVFFGLAFAGVLTVWKTLRRK